MTLASVLSKLKFYVVDKRSEPLELFEYDSRGQAVVAGLGKSTTCRHGKGKYEHCYIIPKTKGKAKQH